MLRVAARGHTCSPPALLLYARCLLEGRGVARDLPQAVRLFRQAAQSGAARGDARVPVKGAGDSWLRGGTRTGAGASPVDARQVGGEDCEARRDAAWELGMLLCAGDDDVEADACEGVEWLEVAGELGHAEAAAAAARAYRLGLGVAQSHEKAMSLEHRASLLQAASTERGNAINSKVLMINTHVARGMQSKGLKEGGAARPPPVGRDKKKNGMLCAAQDGNRKLESCENMRADSRTLSASLKGKVQHELRTEEAKESTDARASKHQDGSKDEEEGTERWVGARDDAGLRREWDRAMEGMDASLMSAPRWAAGFWGGHGAKGAEAKGHSRTTVNSAINLRGGGFRDVVWWVGRMGRSGPEVRGRDGGRLLRCEGDGGGGGELLRLRGGRVMEEWMKNWDVDQAILDEMDEDEEEEAEEE